MHAAAAAPWALGCEGKGGRSSAPRVLAAVGKRFRGCRAKRLYVHTAARYRILHGPFWSTLGQDPSLSSGATLSLRFWLLCRRSRFRRFRRCSGGVGRRADGEEEVLQQGRHAELRSVAEHVQELLRVLWRRRRGERGGGAELSAARGDGVGAAAWCGFHEAHSKASAPPPRANSPLCLQANRTCARIHMPMRMLTRQRLASPERKRKTAAASTGRRCRSFVASTRSHSLSTSEASKDAGKQGQEARSGSQGRKPG